MKKYILGAIYIALLIFFTIECFNDGEKSSSQSNFVYSIIEYLYSLFAKNPNKEFWISFIRKVIGHFAFFVILGTISLFFFKEIIKSYYFIIPHLSINIVYILLSEFLFEGLTNGRNASFVDCLIDFSGFIISLLIYLIYKLINNYRKKKV
jgi:VanZ family protein